MRVLNTKDFSDNNGNSRIFTFDNTIQLDSLIEIIKQFENDKVKMSECHCYTYDGDGHREYYCASSLDDIRLIYMEADSPYFDFIIDFCDKQLLTYSFSLTTSINSKSLIYDVDKKKQAKNSNKSFSNRKY